MGLTNAALSLDVAESAAEYYGLAPGRAREIIDRVQGAVQRWPKEAKSLRISAREQALMKPAFERAANR